MKRISFLMMIFVLFVFACSDGEDNGIKDGGSDVLLTDPDVQKTGYAFIVNAAPDYKSATYSVMNLSDRSVSKDKDVIHTDAVARVFNNLIFVVSRLGADSITILDPMKDFSVIKQFSVGAGSNPQDLSVYKDKIFVTKQNSAAIDVYSSSDYSKAGSIDISKYADADGNAEAQDMIVYKDKLYVSVLRLDKNNYYAPTDKSYMLVIDPSSLKIEKEILLGATNPFAGLVLDEENERILIAETGSFGATDGRVEFYGIKEGFILQQIIPETSWGGDLNRIAYGNNKVFAVVSDSNFNTVLKAYDLVSAQMKSVYETKGFSIAGISVYANKELYLCDRDMKKPGIRIFGIEDLAQKTSDPIDTGLPPVSLVFFSM
ncbi:MAG: hypothetical protein N3B13_10345 [Deltaproteobacteria bacterium]|nr:hypothetical protein [Deltaproteobacteria bacterium]